VSESSLAGTCHCGEVSVTFTGPRDEITNCNCSICTKLGWRMVYGSSDTVQVAGRCDNYVRADLSESFLVVHRCTKCGVPTHWTPLSPPPHERIGVNAALFAEDAFAGASIRKVDGRSWAS
jgi:hypothetical protein